MSIQQELERGITEQQRAENELREAHQNLQARVRKSDADLALANEQMRQLAPIVESSEDAIVGCTLGGFITIWNRGANLPRSTPSSASSANLAETPARVERAAKRAAALAVEIKSAAGTVS